MLLPMLAPEIMMSIRATIKPENGIDDMIWFAPYDGRSLHSSSSPAVLLFVFAACVYVKARSFPCLKYMVFILVARAGDHQMVSNSQRLFPRVCE